MPYATTDNFTGVKLYPSETALLRTAPARALRKVQEVLQKQGLGLCIFDAYRPFRVTCTMWRKAKDRHYVANPMKASKHNRGLAVDLTICERTTGRELDMGTAFDSFTDTAHHTFMALPADVLARRRLLRTVMAQAGFTSIPSEWWHYNWPDPENKYDALDLPFSDLLTQ
jgi:D-alanyl-D-alanine dipeptidase